jgi:hypothetical protein
LHHSQASLPVLFVQEEVCNHFVIHKKFLNSCDSMNTLS